MRRCDAPFRVQCSKFKVQNPRFTNFELRFTNHDFTLFLYQIHSYLLKTRCLRHPRATLSTAPCGANIRVQAKKPGPTNLLPNEPQILYTLSNSMPKLHDLQRGGTKVLQKAKPGRICSQKKTSSLPARQLTS